MMAGLQSDIDSARFSGESRIAVLHVLEATLGGTLRYMENVADSLSASEYRLGFAYGSSRADSRLEPFLHKAQDQGWSLFHLPVTREINLKTDYRALVALVSVLRKFKPDILHCHSSKAGVLGRIAGKMVRPTPRIVYSPHALAIPLGKRYLYIERALKCMTDRYFAVSKSEAAQIVQSGLAKEPEVSVVYPMIDAEQFAPSPERRTLESLRNGPTILGVGRLTLQKDPLTFVRIVSKLQEWIPAARGVWVGDGELRDAFYKAASKAPFANAFELVPWQHDIRPYFEAADVLLSTSIYESFGYMVAEALAMQVPVVATSVTGTCDILEGSFAARMYRRGDEDSAVALLREVLADTEASQAWAAAAQAMVQSRFSRQAMRLSLSNAYQEAITGSYASLVQSKEARS